ncbi:MAG: hypothetical protein AAF372_00975, partial [Pseudomonadota bacterium]
QTHTPSPSSSRSQERRRESYERRRQESIVQFPIITTQGIWVRNDRRKVPDRRLSNIKVRETNIKEEVFATLFSNYLSIDKKGNFRIKKSIVSDNP